MSFALTAYIYLIKLTNGLGNSIISLLFSLGVIKNLIVSMFESKKNEHVSFLDHNNTNKENLI